jgi:hypothetical protein
MHWRIASGKMQHAPGNALPRGLHAAVTRVHAREVSHPPVGFVDKHAEPLADVNAVARVVPVRPAHAFE